jgi:hypothetical protein
MLSVLTVSISLDQQPWNNGKSIFWPKFFIQAPETQKTDKKNAQQNLARARPQILW